MNEKCTHEWYFDQYQNGNYLQFGHEDKIYCTECGEEWFHR